jgi:hypothetical protein
MSTITQAVPTTQVRRATPDELPALARVLTRAFADDPVYGVDLPGRVRPGGAARAVLQRALPAPDGGRPRRNLHRPPCPRGGVMDPARPGRDGNAGPAADAATAGAALRPLAPAHAQDPLHGVAVPRGAALAPAVPRRRPRGPGAGLGSALMQPILERADHEGMPAYLEASTECSRALSSATSSSSSTRCGCPAAARRCGACGASRSGNRRVRLPEARLVRTALGRRLKDGPAGWQGNDWERGRGGSTRASPAVRRPRHSTSRPGSPSRGLGIADRGTSTRISPSGTRLRGGPPGSPRASGVTVPSVRFAPCLSSSATRRRR